MWNKIWNQHNQTWKNYKSSKTDQPLTTITLWLCIENYWWIQWSSVKKNNNSSKQFRQKISGLNKSENQSDATYLEPPISTNII